MTYRIRTVSEITGIPRNTLIAWERRYGVIRPQRHTNGYRSYSEEDVAQLLRLKNAQKAGLKISEAFALLEKGRSGEAPALPESEASLPQWEVPDLEGVRRALVSALVNYNRQEAERLLGKLRNVPFPTRVVEIYFPVLTEIGDLWAKGEVTVAQEHYASSILRAHLASILVNIGPASPKARHAACTTFPGDDHEIAALALAIQLSLSGFRVSYLGPNLPARDLVGFVASQHPELVCVSVINPISDDELTDYAHTIRQGLSPSAQLVIGGRVLENMSVEASNVRIETEWTTGLPF